MVISVDGFLASFRVLGSGLLGARSCVAVEVVCASKQRVHDSEQRVGDNKLIWAI